MNKKRFIFLIFLLLLLIPGILNIAFADNHNLDLNKSAFTKIKKVNLDSDIDYSIETESFNQTMDKIDRLNNNQNIVQYDKIQKLKEQYCFIKIEIKEINGEITKQEIVECADGRKAYDGPSYWELFAQFYYGDMNTPAYCRYYERPNHAYNKPGKVCLDKYGNWEVRK